MYSPDGEQRIRLFEILSTKEKGWATKCQIKLFNNALVEWNVGMKKKKSTANQCTFYQPSVQSQRVRTFLAYVATEYDMVYSLEKNFSFAGGLVPFLSELYAKRYSIYKQVIKQYIYV